MYSGEVTTATGIETLGSDLVVQAARLVRAIRHSVDQPVGVRVLSLLDEFGALSVTELAEIDRCSQPTMSGTVNTLLGNGWVTKESDPQDARRSVVRLTADGAAELRGFRTEVGELIAARFHRSGRYDDASLQLAIDVMRDLLATNDNNTERGIL